MSTHKIGLYEDLTKIIFELSSNTHLVSSAENVPDARVNRRIAAYKADTLLTELLHMVLQVFDI